MSMYYFSKLGYATSSLAEAEYIAYRENTSFQIIQGYPKNSARRSKKQINPNKLTSNYIKSE